MSAKQGWGIAFVVLGLLGVFAAVYRNLIEPGFGDEFFSGMMLDIVLNPLVWLGFVGLWMVVSEQDKSTQKVQPKNYLMEVYNYDWSERVKAARHPKTGQRTLAALAMDKIPAVRQAVAYNQNAGRTVLTELAESDSDTGVQRVALETLEAMAPDKPESERPQAVTIEELRADLRAETDPPEPGTAITMDDLKRELRANPPAEPEAVQEPAGENIQRTLETIERLSALRDSGAITTEEYETLKKKALD